MRSGLQKVHHNSSVEKSANVLVEADNKFQSQSGGQQGGQQVLAAKPGEQLGRGKIYSCSAIYMCVYVHKIKVNDLSY